MHKRLGGLLERVMVVVVALKPFVEIKIRTLKVELTTK
jgi:hypothetical protein